ncbi:hypothetical protein JQK88_32235 [Mesorhizobium caraganae]|uniref:glycine-rich domain-containing protein n=1 Tax=Mesorhizobium caraganae TaxID=483206 RepID=UPI001939513C|nr:hypothetical protein [Mesorhizobium caraganae]MBM2715781.1 hypothetical protein [Mesorhizobium caraganae]
MTEATLVTGSSDLSSIAAVQQSPSIDDEPATGAPHGYAQEGGFIQDALRRTAVAERFDLSVVLARYRRQYGFSQAVAEDHRRELVRFLALCATARQHGHSYGMMGAVDELWHMFVIFTRDYARFCEEVAGRFLHHIPEPHGVATQGTIDRYLAFLEDYRTVYGEAPPPAYWPKPKRSPHNTDTACYGCDACDGCGICGGGCVVDATL